MKQYLYLAVAIFVALAATLAWKRWAEDTEYLRSLDEIERIGGIFFPDKRPLQTEMQVRINNIPIDERSLKCLQGLAYGPPVAIDLSDTQVSDGIFDVISNVPVTHLIAINTKITEDGAKRFKASHPECQIQIDATNGELEPVN